MSTTGWTYASEYPNGNTTGPDGGFADSMPDGPGMSYYYFKYWEHQLYPIDAWVVVGTPRWEPWVYWNLPPIPDPGPGGGTPGPVAPYDPYEPPDPEDAPDKPIIPPAPVPDPPDPRVEVNPPKGPTEYTFYVNGVETPNRVNVVSDLYGQIPTADVSPLLIGPSE